tara:strand:+ start:871 stop:1500 length:630 start_codon:yes stop_codon:yes gene_type:complete
MRARSLIGRRPSALFLALAVSALAALGGCRDPKALLQQRAASAMTAGWPAGRAPTATQLYADWQAGHITLDLALDHAHKLVDQNGLSAIPYSAAVLDLSKKLGDQIPSDPATSSILLRRIGRLAYKSAEAAYLGGSPQQAAALIEAGPDRWKSEPYWRRYPDHDALAAIILAGIGEREQAISRLQSRAVLQGPAEEALEMLRSGVSQGP